MAECASCGRPFAGHLITASEIATLLNVSRQRVDQLMRSPDFPDHQWLGTYRVCVRTDVIRWMETWNRKPGRRAHA